jgi:DUF1680 family protein
MHYPLPKFSPEIRQKCRTAVQLAAQWMKQNQVWHTWPHWTADAGRFNSIISLKNPAIRPQLSICWNTGRTAQALLSAYKLSGEASLLEAAERAAEYVKTCQILDPELAGYRGACREETPLCGHLAARDTVEAVQTFINLYIVTGKAAWLARAELSAEWLASQHAAEGKIAAYDIWFDGRRKESDNDFTKICMSAEGLIWSQLDTLVGRKKYSPYTGESMDYIRDTLLKADGALRVADNARVDHHVSRSGALNGCFTNDDGFGVSLIAAFRVTGDKKYKEAALRYGNFWATMDDLPATYASLPAVLLFLLDMYRFTGEEKYLKKSETYIAATLKLQHRQPEKPLLHGGFKGHEFGDAREEKEYPGDSLDYLCLRTAMYAVIALAKAAAEKEEQWNAAYSGFGW